MSNTLAQYREARQNWMKLRNQAKKELITRFHEVSAELLQIQRELLEDFGEKVTIPTKAKKGVAKKAAAAVAVVSAPVIKDSPEVAALKKKIEAQQKKLNEVRAAGKPTKAIEDRIYELEDDLRLIAD
ncbi:MAG: hypothetical protein K7J46_14125 [Bryobacter sp.]|jgi:hypothetical protein|nr:hypothetical protein [Bryobacter sp. CoA8 C33]